MLYMVQMAVDIPYDSDPTLIEKLKKDEKIRSEELQRQGKWRHLWRVAGLYANVSIFDVDDHAELHGLLTALPLYPFMKITVTPLCQHPSAIVTE